MAKITNENLYYVNFCLFFSMRGVCWGFRVCVGLSVQVVRCGMCEGGGCAVCA